MPMTRAQHEKSLEDPAVCELLKIRDFLDNVMVRTDGCYVAGFRVAGTMTYFSDDAERNEAKSVLESLLRAIPEQSMRLQFRYEVVESLNGLLDLYRNDLRSENTEVRVLDEHRVANWLEKERQGVGPLAEPACRRVKRSIHRPTEWNGGRDRQEKGPERV